MSADFEGIAKRLKGLLGSKTDLYVAAALNLSPRAYNERKRRGSVPYQEIVVLASARGWSLDAILLGRELSPAAVPDKDAAIEALANAVHELGKLRRGGKP